MTNSHKNIINPFLESSTLLIMTFPEIVESKDLLWGRTCAVDNVRARRKGVLGKLYEIQISPERGLRNSLKFPSYFGMEYVRPWNMGKKLLECMYIIFTYHATLLYCIIFYDIFVLRYIILLFLIFYFGILHYFCDIILYYIRCCYIMSYHI